MKKRFLLSCLLTICILAACGSKGDHDPAAGTGSGSQDVSAGEPAEESTSAPEHTQVSAEYYEIPKKENSGVYAANVQEFDLGEGVYTSPAGKKMPYRLRGVIGVPDGEGKFPLVLITHGSHSNIDESERFDTGFTYLVQALAEGGYIAVSMDMSKPYIWKYGDSDDKEKSVYLADEHLKSLKAADEGGGGYPIDLEGKIDLESVAFIGHSRGGDTVFDIALDQQQKNRRIKAILSLAPTLPADADTKEWPDSDASIIVPEYDGDVISMDGYMFYTVLDDKSNRMRAVTMLNRANHNGFNKNIQERPDMTSTEEWKKDQLKPEEQQEFLVSYALDFLKASLKNDVEGTMYQYDRAQPNKMYGYDVQGMLNGPEAVEAAGLLNTDNLSQTGLTVENTQDSWFYETDRVILDTITFGRGNYQTKPLMRIEWSEKNNSLSMAAAVQDFNPYQAITLNMVVDAADSLNAEKESQSLTVALTDKEGNRSEVTLPDGLNSLRNTPGKIDSTPLEDTELVFFSALTPVSSTRIPLHLFKGINLNRIETIALEFNQTDSGAVYLQSLLLQK